MTDATSRFALPYIVPGQAQKEVWHNEALALIDASLHAAVEGAPLAAPPVAPTAGQCWIIADAATGDWAGRDANLACYTEAGWRFVAPQAGMTAWDKATGLWRHWTGTTWSGGEWPVAALRIGGAQVVGPRQPSILSPSGGTTIDAEARVAVDAIIAALISHGLID